ncbi:MAG TPA: mechanosensitive ion channel domain-containing protein [Cryomorphaceae bacterium]|nr:mechanosensitive ion channel domain-containing protein [Cryomorphaceae bacterium]
MQTDTDFAEFIEVWLHESMGVDMAMTQTIKMVILFVLMLFSALILWMIGQFIINRILKKVILKTSTDWDDIFMEQGVFRKMGHIIPAVVISELTPIVFTDYPEAIPAIEQITDAFVIFIVIRVIVSLISAMTIFFSRSPKFKDKPIASFTQLAKIIIWSVGGIILFGILFGKNPLTLFTALGAVSAVLILVFKDTILGFMASIQLTINDMVRIGDWVSVPQYGADGDVIEINLTTVKVANWDKTISTVPTYSFVSDSFKNWRGMQESGGRRIKRAINLKISKVKFCDQEMLDRFSKVALVKDYIAQRKKEIDAYNSEKHIDTKSSVVNGRRMTNIGILRAYILNYIKQNPNINQEMTCMVRQLEATEKGVPLEVYCFSAIKAWVDYERIQSDMFDHILAAVHQFDLEVFENPAGSDWHQMTLKQN